MISADEASRLQSQGLSPEIQTQLKKIEKKILKRINLGFVNSFGIYEENKIILKELGYEVICNDTELFGELTSIRW